MRSLGTQAKKRSLSSQAVTVTAKTSVVTARYRPCRRNAGSPTASAAIAPANPPTRSASVRSMCQWLVTHADVAAPIAKNAT